MAAFPLRAATQNSLKLAVSVAPGENHLLRLEGAVSVWIEMVTTLQKIFLALLNSNGFLPRYRPLNPSSYLNRPTVDEYSTLSRGLARALLARHAVAAGKP